MASQAKNPFDLNEVDAKLQISVRNDLMANLGGDFLIAFDGPALPTPAWKMVIEVNNPVALETSLERMTKAIDGEMHDPKNHPVTIEGKAVDGQQYYTIRDQVTGAAMGAPACFGSTITTGMPSTSRSRRPTPATARSSRWPSRRPNKP